MPKMPTATTSAMVRSEVVVAALGCASGVVSGFPTLRVTQPRAPEARLGARCPLTRSSCAGAESGGTKSTVRASDRRCTWLAGAGARRSVLRAAGCGLPETAASHQWL